MSMVNVNTLITAVEFPKSIVFLEFDGRQVFPSPKRGVFINSMFVRMVCMEDESTYDIEIQMLEPREPDNQDVYVDRDGFMAEVDKGVKFLMQASAPAMQ